MRVVSFFKHRVPKDASESSFAPESVSQNDSKQHNDVQRELVMVVLKNTLHRLGIPHDWLACEVITLAHKPGQEKLHIQLMLMQWNEIFMRYAPALEKQLLRGLARIDPTVDATKYIISWRFSPDCGCPFRVMPPPKVWAHDAAPAPSAQHPPQSPTPLMHITQPSNEPQTVRGPLPDEDDYQRTQLSPLR